MEITQELRKYRHGIKKIFPDAGRVYIASDDNCETTSQDIQLDIEIFIDNDDFEEHFVNYLSSRDSMYTVLPSDNSVSEEDEKRLTEITQKFISFLRNNSPSLLIASAMMDDELLQLACVRPGDIPSEIETAYFSAEKDISLKSTESTTHTLSSIVCNSSGNIKGKTQTHTKKDTPAGYTMCYDIMTPENSRELKELLIPLTEGFDYTEIRHRDDHKSLCMFHHLTSAI